MLGGELSEAIRVDSVRLRKEKFGASFMFVWLLTLHLSVEFNLYCVLLRGWCVTARSFFCCDF